MFGREISRDLIASLRGAGLIAAGPRSPQPGAPYAYVTTGEFLSQFGFESLRDLPDLEKLEDAGLVDRTGTDDQSAVGEGASGNAAAHLSQLLRVVAGSDELDEDAA